MNKMPECHIFGLQDDEVVIEIKAKPGESNDTLEVEVRRNPNVPLLHAATIVKGVGYCLYRLANNPEHFRSLEESPDEIKETALFNLLVD